MYQSFKASVLLSGVMAAILAAPHDTSAGLFGWGYYPYYDGYSTYYPPMGWRTAYAPGYYGSGLAMGGCCAPACDPCGCNPCGCNPCCSPCGTGGCGPGGCPGGNCNVPPLTGGQPAPVPDPNVTTPPADSPPRRTFDNTRPPEPEAPIYEEPMPSTRGGTGTGTRTRGSGTTLPEDGFTPRTPARDRTNSGSEPAGASGASGASATGDAFEGADPGSFEQPGSTSRRINLPEEQVIPARKQKPAETAPVNDDSGPTLEGRTTSRPVVTKARLSLRDLEHVRMVQHRRPGVEWSALEAKIARH